MHQINLLDETFDKNQSHHYHLSIQTGPNGLSFCLFDTVKSKFIVFRHYPLNSGSPEELNCLLTTDELLKLSYKATSMLVTEGMSTLVPASLFDESSAETFYRFNLGEEGDKKIYFNHLQETQAFNIFSCSPELLSKYNAHFPSLKVFHRSSPFINHLVQESAKWHRLKCFVSIHDGILDIGLAQQKKLEFFNSFVYRENPDIVYHILNVLDQFKLSMNATDIFMSANIEKHDDLFEYLNNYLNQIKFIRPSEKFTYSYIFDEFQLTRFANLFNTELCE
jgi:hypothetical protein